MNADEREIVLAEMNRANSAFYYAAVRIGNHPFIEFSGLMAEYVKLCTQAHKQGIDFSECNTHSGTHLPMLPHQVDYINEKLECIFTGRCVMSAPAEKEENVTR
jgi:hypothetical protein